MGQGVFGDFFDGKLCNSKLHNYKKLVFNILKSLNCPINDGTISF